MGKKSRTKKERRSLRSAGENPDSLRDAFKAERRGRSIPPTVEAYEAAALRGGKYVREALIARHNRRMMTLFRRERLDFSSLRTLMGHASILDICLKDFGANPFREVVSLGSDWPSHLLWGVDSVHVAARYLFSGQLIGAAVVARIQLERWTDNLIFNAGMEPIEGEGRADQIARAWGLHREALKRSAATVRGSSEPLDLNGVKGARDTIEWHVDEVDEELVDISAEGGTETSKEEPFEIIPGRPVMPGKIFRELSELLHGRGPLVDAVTWEASDLLDRDEGRSGVYKNAIELIVDALTISIDRIRSCVVTLAIEGRRNPSTLITGRDLWAPSGIKSPWGWSLLPLTPEHGLQEAYKEQYDNIEICYRQVLQGRRPAGRLYDDAELSDLVFLSRRARAYTTARSAFLDEARTLGSNFNIHGVEARLNGYIISAELAGICATWIPLNAPSRAASVSASALRTAAWMWLEDDDRAMGVMRVVLEQSARLRVWRTKPRAAEKLEGSPRTTPRDWLEAAGWKRLRIVIKALGEVVHMNPNSRWFGARQILAESHSLDGEEPAIQMARGSTLDLVALILSIESNRWLERFSPTAATAMASIIGPDDIDGLIERWLNKSWTLRTAHFGPPMFSRESDE